MSRHRSFLFLAMLYTASAPLLVFSSRHLWSPNKCQRTWQSIKWTGRSLKTYSPSAMRYPEIPVLSAIVAVLLLVPLPSQLRACSIPTLALTLSTILLSIIHVVNALIWNGDTRDVASRWCDFASTFDYCWRYLALGSCLCFCKHLEWITSSRSAVSGRHYQVLFEVTFCFIVPLISILIRYCFAPYRYIIFEDFGCLAYVYSSKITVTLTWVPDIVIGFSGFIFACLAARNLIIRRLIAKAHNSTSMLTTPRFVRLLLFCLVVGVWPLLVTLLSSLFPTRIDKGSSWPGWAAMHQHFYDIPAIPLRFLTTVVRRSILRKLWYQIIGGFLIFCCLVVTEDARNDLRRFWELLTHRTPRPRRCNATPPSSPLRDTLGRGSHAHMLTTSVVDISAVKLQFGESSGPCEPVPDPSNAV